ncbi:Uncharacterised protein [Streptococcus pneumoniae]|nr:Uncharacterised protein [Streptococcus pneumoniae]
MNDWHQQRNTRRIFDCKRLTIFRIEPSHITSKISLKHGITIVIPFQNGIALYQQASDRIQNTSCITRLDNLQPRSVIIVPLRDVNKTTRPNQSRKNRAIKEYIWIVLSKDFIRSKLIIGKLTKDQTICKTVNTLSSPT